MKKVYLMALSLLAGAAIAQKPVIQNGPNVSREATKSVDRADPSPVRIAPSAGITYKALGKKSFATKIGETQNDQQTNATIYRHTQLLPGGKVSATWTTSSDPSPYSTRGSGYNHFDGSSWGQANSTRIDAERSGFPCYVYNPTTNEEIITSHIVKVGTGNAGGILMNRKTGLGAGTWTSNTVLDTIATLPGVLWNQTAISGDYMIVIASYTDSTPTQPNRVVMDGVRTPQVYSRYQFSTNTWLVKNQLLPGYDNSRVYAGGGDNYSIDANGSNVAILIGGLTDDVALWKSTDAGATWTKTIIDSFPVPAYDYKTLFDTTFSNDGAVHVSLDNSGTAHCFWALARVLDANVDDNTVTYFPGQVNLMYWNEGMSLDSIQAIAGMPDENNNQALDLAASWNDAGARYGNHSIVTMPYAAMDENGTIFVVYSSLTEDDISTDSKNFRDVYCVFSKDGGKTWSESKNLTSWLGLNVEQIFASVSKNMDGRLHMTFLQKLSIGRYDASTNPGAAGIHDVMYMVIDTADIFGSITSIGEVRTNELFTVGQNYPNPFNGSTTIPVSFQRTTDVNVTVIDMVGKEVYNQNFENISSGNNNLKLEMGSLPTGIYLYTVEADGFKVSRRMIVE
ncbi:MAG: T9SS type A sorting domain-containing protein [Bacteroidia bacterium]|nr:T9SS type A sorting domain-containing protein [Bacteroidia bacterium]MCF8448070.1 T9SS type A sorting domain-containing protein [Bacteroidia bacterium]